MIYWKNCLKKFTAIILDLGFFLQRISACTLDYLLLGLQHGLTGLFNIHRIISFCTHRFHFQNKNPFVSTNRKGQCFSN